MRVEGVRRGGASPAPAGGGRARVRGRGHLIRPSVRTGAHSPQGEGKRDVGDAVPYGCAADAGLRRRGGACPSRNESSRKMSGSTRNCPIRSQGPFTNGPLCRPRVRERGARSSQAVRRPRDVEDAVPYGQRKNGISRRKIPFSYTVSYTVILPRFSYSFQAATCSRSHWANSSMPSPVRAQMGMIFMLGLRRRTYSRHLSRSKSK